MKIKSPCKLGHMFSVRRKRERVPVVLTGLTFYWWESCPHPGAALLSKKDIKRDRLADMYHAEDTYEGEIIVFEVPDELFRKGYPLREIGLDTDAVGYIQCLRLTEDSWEYRVFFGNEGVGTTDWVRTEELDRLFAPILPIKEKGERV